MSECLCYTSLNTNTNKDEHTLARECPVHREEAAAFYAAQDARVAEISAKRHPVRLGMCDKRQYEHNGPHVQIVEGGQNFPPFPCVNWHPVVSERVNEIGFAGEVPDNALICKALRIAVEVHGMQTDKAGEPYCWHVFRVAMAMDTAIGQVCGLLHDVLEDSDTPASWEHAISIEFPPEVVACCKLLCHRKDASEAYLDYIRRVSASPLATKVKLADLRDNLNPLRLVALPPETDNRLLTKYGQAVKLLVMSKGPR